MSDDGLKPRNSPPPAESPFQPGCVYYQVGIKEVPGGGFSTVVSSWVYLGFIHRPGVSSTACDVPEHFYEFQDFAHITPGTPEETWRSPKLCLSTCKGESMVTWDVLLEYLNDIDEQRRNDHHP